MQKLKEKKILGTVPKKLQLVETFWDCPEFSRNKQNQKGITLIALIITIIVMLILVGVTINVSLNGGLFTKAEEATRESEEKVILEEMLAIMEITEEGKFDYEEIISRMREQYGEENVEYSYPNATITGKLGTYNYIVSETEIKIGVSNSLEMIKTYFLGAIDEVTGERPGINLTTEETIIAEPDLDRLMQSPDASEIKFKNNDIITDAYTNMIVNSRGVEGDGYYMYIKYDKIYKLIIGADFVTVSIEPVYDN